MLFNSLSFLIFFPIVVLLYFVCPARFRYIWLLIASYYFYMSWDPVFAILILFCTAVTWTGALLIEKYRGSHAKAVLAASVVMVGAVLFYFKYLGFAARIVNSLMVLFKFQGFDPSRFNIVLPVGISFFTFQSVGYCIDVYRGEIPAERDFLKYALFVSFFPQLVAGPIERSKNLIGQLSNLDKLKPWNPEKAFNGLVYMAYGFFLKLVLADSLAIVCDTVFGNYTSYGGIELIVGALAFSLQIYFDFSSYSAIAIGAAQVMGITLMENFSAPYFSISIREFWRRWHISLSSWFRDYLYIPLGGSRCSKLRNYLNIMITFMVSGLWHGAAMAYVVWGGIHGLYQIAGKEYDAFRNRFYPRMGINLQGELYLAARVVGTFILTTLAWIFFRVASLRESIDYIRGIFSRFNPWALTDGSLSEFVFQYRADWYVLAIGLMIAFAVDMILCRRKKRIDVFLAEQGSLIQVLALSALIIYTLLFGRYGGGYDEQAFIYFQF